MNEIQVLKRFTAARESLQCLRTKIYFNSKALERSSYFIEQRILMIYCRKLMMLVKPHVKLSNNMLWYTRREDSYDAERR